MSQNMQVIFDPIDAIEMAVFINQKLVEVGKKAFLLIWYDGGFSVFGRKNKMIQKLGMCGHNRLILCKK